ncbi:MAG: hypothetical protein NZL91_05440 [Thermoflexales bacterium]|nr:hypothetical protein [Thermoflexales bacterium]
MALEYADFRALVEALQAHPEWRAELRRLVLTDELLELPALVRELAEAQRRAEERLTRLEEAFAEAQRHTDERLTRLEEAVAALAEAQRRAEERLTRLEDRVTRLEEAVAILAEAQQRTEKRLDTLELAVGKLQQTFGATLEEEAASVLEFVMEEKGFRALEPETTLALDGEIDVLRLFSDSAGRRVWGVVEAKARLSQREVRAWVQRVRDPNWQRRLAERGLHGPCYLYFYAIRVDIGARKLIESEGVGLLTSRGEVVAPQVPIDLP